MTEDVVKHTIRMPPKMKRRLLMHRSMTGIISNKFALDAIERALDEAGVPQDPSRIKRRAITTKQSA